MNNFINYLRETRAELKHVSWPTQKTALIYTALVTAISILVGLFTGGFDYIFNLGIDWFIQ